MTKPSPFDPLVEQMRTNQARADLRHPNPAPRTIHHTPFVSEREAADAARGITRVEQRHHLDADGRLKIEQRPALRNEAAS